ncbi:tetratricopeptide repeat protein [Pulveribacter suum]|uniref:Sel1 repeat family protein n=1 Tax=Pulveribacter suum TaxID=2116657 RepID=A0A2P1NL25_9BURK|nr:SEL1-like repeat protein [Pulveribacter suum]AVP57740.1 hypothetical protein C7H73_08755 [Pulveribacter suum]
MGTCQTRPRARRHTDTLLLLVATAILLAGTATTAPAQLLVATGPVAVDEPLIAERPGPVQPGDVRPPTGTIELSGPTGSGRIEPSGTPLTPSLRLPAEPDAAAQLRLQRLRGAATAPARRGSAAERSAAHSAWVLGLLYLHGEGVALDRAQALRWFERAQAHGEPLASAAIAWCHIDGCQGPPDPAAARQWIERLAPVDAGLALLLQWWVQERQAPLQAPAASPRGRPATGDTRTALLQRAARAGSASAMNELGLIELTAARPPQALALFRQAALRSPAAAANAELLAARLQQQEPAPASRSSTVQPPTQRSAQDWLQQAQRYHRGEGVPSNYTEAIRLYQIAAAGGSQEARRMLELIYSRPAPDGVVNVAWMRQLATMQVTPEGAVLTMQAPPTPRLFVRDPTPLYGLIPPQWRTGPQLVRP